MNVRNHNIINWSSTKTGDLASSFIFVKYKFKLLLLIPCQKGGYLEESMVVLAFSDVVVLIKSLRTIVSLMSYFVYLNNVFKSEFSRTVTHPCWHLHWGPNCEKQINKRHTKSVLIWYLHTLIYFYNNK